MLLKKVVVWCSSFWQLLRGICYNINWSYNVLHSDNDFYLQGCQNISHHYQQQSLLGQLPIGWTPYVIKCHPWVQIIYYNKSFVKVNTWNKSLEIETAKEMYTSNKMRIL